ncbi:hypothetical protein [Pedobacter insulae]|uniref:Uncharacterized protein n=1 Tax=Pedobacter insulae TaxID=414048 RepID=A0A1I2WWF5_9SPHI|nr:hypothetical protein [Pedobacter insulae]SFH03971.1 hypothetical protein SAMN04489864_104241 [Pedobacter insulae]
MIKYVAIPYYMAIGRSILSGKDNRKEILENKKMGMISNMASKLAAVIFMGMSASCVSLKTPQREDLVSLMAPMEIGKYPVSVNRTVTSKSRKDTIISTVVWQYFKNSEGKDSLDVERATHIKLKMVDGKNLVATLYHGDVSLKTEIMKGSLKKGYFRARHDFSMKGVPPFYWKTSSAKIQFGIGREGQLYIDTADETNGSILIMVAGTPGFTRSLTVPAIENK